MRVESGVVSFIKRTMPCRWSCRAPFLLEWNPLQSGILGGWTLLSIYLSGSVRDVKRSYTISDQQNPLKEPSFPQRTFDG